MKTSDAAKIREMMSELTSKVMFAVSALLCIGFIMECKTRYFRPYAIKALPLFNCTYARKRVFTRVVHHRKFALFTGGSEQGPFK